MFNYIKVKKLKEDNGFLRARLEKFRSECDELLVYSGRPSFVSTYPEYSISAWVAELKKDIKDKAERAKIESIVRDLLKKNVFKEAKE